MNNKPQVLATAITCRPRPLPSLAPSIIPGKSSNLMHETMDTIKVKVGHYNYTIIIIPVFLLP